ncbi:hypothetical protein BB215W447A_1219 [Bifidobacterium breve]|uniref:Uncharacterized protein n=1 Tax=Bifidobacterium breve TaxID=1685 RepID=A0A2K9BWW6_BIFBR|nr:hypothetical protein BB215W447A_1219 [Bifidobacterium breve]
MHLFWELLSFIPFSLMGHAYHAYACMPIAGTGGTKPKTGAERYASRDAYHPHTRSGGCIPSVGGNAYRGV